MLEALGEQAELALPSDETSTTDLTFGVAHEPVRRLSVGSSAQRLQLEVTAERDGGARADDHVTRIGVRHEGLEDGRRLAAAASLDRHLAVRSRHQQGGGVQGATHLGPRGIVAPRTDGQPPDGRGGVHGAAWRILGGIHPEGHDGAGRSHAVDPAAEASRLVDDALERAGHLG